jgi:hypothetical protein
MFLIQDERSCFTPIKGNTGWKVVTRYGAVLRCSLTKVESPEFVGGMSLPLTTKEEHGAR